MSHYLKVLLQDVFNASRCRWDDGRKQYSLGNPIQYFTRVRVMGIVRACRAQAIELDDGTAVIAVQFATPMPFRVGDLVDCIGELQPSRQALRPNYILSTHILPVQDPNMETLRFLEIIQLYKDSYFSGRTTSVSELTRPLAPLPTAVMAGIKRKFGSDTLEYLFDDGGGLQKQRKLQAGAEEYYLTVPDTECDRLVKGQRHLELRVNKPPYSIIVAGDRILFNGSYGANVHAVRNYASLAIALQSEDITTLLPAGVPSNLAPAHFRAFVSEADETMFGVAIFELERPAAAVPTGDPLTLVQELLEEANMTLEQLTSRLATLPPPAIVDALSQLQLDGMIYKLPSGHYSFL
ncbi:Aste57867_14190 [Aphanomyces stellatus]|uniref:Aste57867_14190 protein n=1 Tax=Aphanomyces stellatus TaxID=120398 RepID=A0A485L0R5_9STRA|nr:hypothetical protein As57867_014139 [Aphanomyces stellatus]VFT91015.1 Aste57867_14190 [Aphanomyces stellatus]